MKLRSIRLSGFAGIPLNQELAIEQMGKMNVLIGPNNAGKSSVIRFLMQLAGWLREGVWSPNASMRVDDYWMHDKEKGIKALLELGNFNDSEILRATSDKGSVSVVDSNGRMRLRVSSRSTFVDLIPDYYVGINCKGPLLRNPGESSITVDGAFPTFSSHYKSFSKSFVFFDPIRAVDRSGGPQMESGGSLLQNLTQMALDSQQAKRWRRFRADLLRHINAIIGPLGMPQVNDVEMKQDNIMNVYLDSLPHVEMQISRLGTGISQLFIILSLLILRKDDSLIVCLEEPESNLHPGLMRRFVDQLRKFENVQFIFTSHSHVLLDCLKTEDRVFRLQQRKDGSCFAESCEGMYNQHNLLDSLGIRASSLLQINCVIWVEGPSDRLYIRKWLSQEAPQYEEGRDYGFILYGGSLLKHFEINTKEQMERDIICMLSISRFAAVVMDKDLTDHESFEGLAPRKKAIRNSAAADAVHRLAVITKGREIENDIPRAVLLEGAAMVLGVEVGIIENADLTGDRGYEHEIAEVLGTEDAKELSNRVAKLADKVALAQKVINVWNKNSAKCGTVPEYIPEIIKLIERSEQIEG